MRLLELNLVYYFKIDLKQNISYYLEHRLKLLIMKKIFFTLLIAIIGSTLSANHESINLSDTTVFTNKSANETNLAEVLIDGIWTTQSETAEQTTTLQFTNAGLVGILSMAAAGISDFNHKYWHLEGFTENVYLILTDLENDASETFLLKKMPFGIAMTNIETGKMLDFHEASAKEIENVRIMQKSLAGEWNSAIHYLTDNKENRKVTFHYSLDADGSFTRNVERFGCQVRSEKGYWQIAPSGDHLILHFAKKNDVFVTKLAKIKYLAFDELVIDVFFTDAELEKEMNKQVKTLFLNKE